MRRLTPRPRGARSPAAPTAEAPAAPTAEVPARPGLVIEDAQTGWCGAVVGVEVIGGMQVVTLEDRHARVRSFPLGPGFLLDGVPVRLVRDRHRAPAPAPAPAQTASGSVRVDTAARVARPGRLYVEGRHDAELVEKVWGDDLRVEGVVVELLDGVDNLPGAVADFKPGPEARLGVLVDHLVPGSKEARIAQAVAAGPYGGHVLVVGHPFVDVWAAVRPAVLGLDRWPAVPVGQDWKRGVLARLGWPHRTPEDLGVAWRRILGGVRSYADLDPALSGRVEELIDFVTAPAG